MKRNADLNPQLIRFDHHRENLMIFFIFDLWKRVDFLSIWIFADSKFEFFLSLN